jgi:hypothetical protein
MPSKNAKQAFLMKMAATNKKFAEDNDIDQDVAKDVYEADKKKEAEKKAKQPKKE